MGKIRKLVPVNDNLEPLMSLNEIFGRFPINCGKCFKEIGSKIELIAFCEPSEEKNMVWFIPLHIECVNTICEEKNEVIVSVNVNELKNYSKVFFKKKEN